MSTDCLRRVAVQRRQTIRLTLYDFELDVRRAGHCLDVLKVTTPDGVEYFDDCGVLGKQTIDVNATEAIIRFTTGQSSLPQRGYLIYFEGRLFLICWWMQRRDGAEPDNDGDVVAL